VPHRNRNAVCPNLKVSHTNDTTVPWWWAETHDELRTRTEKILEQLEVFRLQTVDHGQRTTYSGNRPVEITKTASGESAHTHDTGSVNSVSNHSSSTRRAMDEFEHTSRVESKTTQVEDAIQKSNTHYQLADPANQKRRRLRARTT